MSLRIYAHFAEIAIFVGMETRLGHPAHFLIEGVESETKGGSNAP